MNVGGVNECVVLPVAEKGKNIIVLFWCGDIDQKQIKEYMSANLPDYMVPTAYVKVEEMPINANDKLDRKRLLTLYENEKNQKQCESDCDETTRKILDIISESIDEDVEYLLCNKELSFQELGIDSITYVEMIVAMEMFLI